MSLEALLDDPEAMECVRLLVDRGFSPVQVYAAMKAPAPLPAEEQEQVMLFPDVMVTGHTHGPDGLERRIKDQFPMRVRLQRVHPIRQAQIPMPEPVQQQQQPEPVCPECGGQGIAGAWVECERCKGKAD